MPINVLSDTDKDIRYIYHFSDIHVSKNSERHKEYREVFENTYNLISKSKSDNLIVLCGDLVHEKSSLAPEQISLIKEFLYRLSEFHPVIIILGNHDINPNNSHINSISPIIDKMRTSNPIYLLKDAGLYQYNNIIFGLTTMFCESVTVCKKKYTEGKIKVGLYHGIINGAKLDNGLHINNSRYFNITDFTEKYDITMLGDVHKHSYLNKGKSIAYSSSLIQQNIGEDPIDHGYIKWDMHSLKGEYTRVPNRYGLMKVHINDTGITTDIENLNVKYPTFYIYYSDISWADAHEYAEQIKEKYPHCKYTLHCDKIKDMKKIEVGDTVKKSLIKISDKTDLYNIIIDYIKKDEKYKKFNKKKKAEFNLTVEDMINDVNYGYNMDIRSFKLEELAFDNFFLYGEGNHINYSSLEGVVGLVAPSYTGKSTTIDCLLYSIFGHCSRGGVVDTINIKETSMTTYVKFKINNDVYEVRRVRNGKRNTTSNKTKKTTIKSSEVVYLTKNGKNETKDTLDITNSEINNIVGGYDNFVNMIIMLQKRCDNFVDMTATKRKEMLCKVLKLDVLNQIVSMAKTQKNSSTKNMKFLKNNVSEINLEEANVKLGDKLVKQQDKLCLVKAELNKLMSEMIEQKVKMESIGFNKESSKEIDRNTTTIKEESRKLIESTKEINKLVKDKTSIEEKYNDQDIESVNKEIEKQEDKLTHLTNSKRSCRLDIIKDRDSVTEKLKEVTIKLVELAEDEEKTSDVTLKEIEDSISKYMKKQSKVESLTNKLNDLIADKEHAETRISTYKDYEYDKNCAFCVNNSKKYGVEDARSALTRINARLLTFSNEKADLEDYIEEYMEKYEDNLLLRDKLKTREFILKDIESLNREKESLESRLNEIKEASIMVKFNKDKDIEIGETKTKIKELRNIINESNRLDKECINIDKLINKKTTERDLIAVKIEALESSNKSMCKQLSGKHDYEKLESEYNRLRDLVDLKEADLSSLEDAISETNKEKMIIELKKADLDEKAEEIKKTERAIAYYEILIDTLGGESGIINNIIDKNVLPKLEENVNTILANLGEYTVELIRRANGIDIIKRVGKSSLNIDTNSGCEEFISNIAFRMVLLELNNNIRSEMMIIDEALRFCDDKTIRNLETLLDYMRDRFKYIIMISHDERIIRLYDKEYNIIRKKGKSYINID